MLSSHPSRSNLLIFIIIIIIIISAESTSPQHGPVAASAADVQPPSGRRHAAPRVDEGQCNKVGDGLSF